MKKTLFVVIVIASFSALSLSSCIGKSNEMESIDIEFADSLDESSDSEMSDIEAIDSLAAALDAAAMELDSVY